MKLNAAHRIIMILGIVFFAVSSIAAIPLQLNHQGVVKVSGIAFDGNGDFSFALIDGSSGNNLWTNDGTQLGTTNQPTAAVTLTVSQGLYSVNLGDALLTNMTAIPSTVFNTDDVKLRIWFDDGGGAVQLSPDLPMTSAPYAYTAANADALGSVPAADYATDAEVAVDLADKSDATHTHALDSLSGQWVALDNLSATPASTADRIYQIGDELYWQDRLISGEATDATFNANSNGDFLINADTIIHDSLAVGSDAMTGLDFQFDTVILKENNTRLYFHDTSNSASFPSTDWRLQANDSNNGGRDYFGIVDVSNGRMPLYVGAGAPNDSLVVNRSDGYVGIHNSRPEGLLDVLIREDQKLGEYNTSVNDTLTGGLVAQSITAASSGTLESVDMVIRNFVSAPFTVELRLYSGTSPVTGTLLQSISAVSVPSSTPSVVTFNFSTLATPVTLTAGANYVLEINDYASNNLSMDADTSDPYAGGVAYTKESYMSGSYTTVAGTDLYFLTYIKDTSTPVSGLIVSSTGLVGINTRTPFEALNVAGAVMIESSGTVPADTTSRLYNSGGNLYWNGMQLDAVGSTGDFMADGSVAMTGNLNLGGNGITNLGTDLADSDVADDLTITGGTITNTTVGIGGAAAGQFTVLSANTLNTGQGANDLYAMNQDVETTDDVTFNSVAAGTFNAGSGAVVLPQGTDVSGNTAEGRISWDSDDDKLYVGDGAAVVEIGAGGGSSVDVSLTDSATLVNPGSTYTTIASKTYNAPANGTVLIIVTGYAQWASGTSPDNTDEVFIGIATTNNGNPVNNPVHSASYQADAYTTQHLASVSAGNNTFYLVAKSDNVNVDYNVVVNQFTVLFFP